VVSLADDNFAHGSAFRHARDHKLIGAYDHRRIDIAEADVRTITFRETFAADLELTAGNCRGRGHLQDLRRVIGALPSSHERGLEESSIKITPP
jgi:hypothetical protein